MTERSRRVSRFVADETPSLQGTRFPPGHASVNDPGRDVHGESRLQRLVNPTSVILGIEEVKNVETEAKEVLLLRQ